VMKEGETVYRLDEGPPAAPATGTPAAPAVKPAAAAKKTNPSR
jgi:hypothetical protein